MMSPFMYKLTKVKFKVRLSPSKNIRVIESPVFRLENTFRSQDI